MSVSYQLCVLAGKVSARDRSLVQRSPTQCVCVSLAVMKCINILLHLQ